MKLWKRYGIWIFAAEAVGILSGILSRQGMAGFSQTALQPALSPPAILFPIVWGILYALMGIGAARVWNSADSSAKTGGINVYIVQLVVNFFWSLIFFNAGAYGFALLWLTFAAYLNYGVWNLNQ